MTGTVRPLGPDDIEQVSRLSQLAFGHKSEHPAVLRGMFGIDGPDGRLLAVARIRDYEQWWGGRRVPMGGIADVAVHPDGRGRGLATALLRGLLAQMRAQAQPISVLFPTGIGVYRPIGWEVVGALQDTRIPTRDLQPAGTSGPAELRTAGTDDTAALGALYEALCLGRNGMLTRDGSEFPVGAAAALEHDVVSLVEGPDRTLLGYAAYNRGSGYREGSELRVWECLAGTAPAMSTLLGSLASWSTVAASVLWRGPTDELGLHLRRPVPAPAQVQPWMLRVVDAPAAIERRGFLPGVRAAASFLLADPDVPANSRAWRLDVDGGRGSLEPLRPDADLPVLQARGLALLFAAAADTAMLLRAGLLDHPLPALDAAFAGPLPQILDYF